MNQPYTSLASLGCLLAVMLGCSSGRSQVAKVQEEKEQLIAAIREQKQELNDLRVRNETLAQRLQEAEIEIARGPSFGERRFASRAVDGAQIKTDDVAQKVAQSARAATGSAGSASPPATVEKLLPIPTGPAVSEVPSKLAWKPFRAETDPTSNDHAESAKTESLATWAEQRNWLSYDQATQSVTVAIPLKFADDGTTLDAEAKQKLDELASLLNSGAGKTMRVMVAGHSSADAGAKSSDAGQRYTSARHEGSAQALAVADYLDRRGIASDRLGITAVADNSSASKSAANSRLSIHILPGDTPVVGWTPPADSVRR